MNNAASVWLAAGLRTPFVGVDGPFQARDSLDLVGAGGAGDGTAGVGRHRLRGVGFGGRQSRLRQSGARNLAGEQARPHVPTFTTVMQCSTSMVGVFEAAGMLGRAGALAVVGGVESMTRVQIGLGQDFSVWLRRVFQARNAAERLRVLRRLRPSDIRLFVPEVKNRVTGRSMGEHTEDMAKDWQIGRHEQDELALESHQRAVAAQDRGFFADLIVPLDGVDQGSLSAARHLDR